MRAPLPVWLVPLLAACASVAAPGAIPSTPVPATAHAPATPTVYVGEVALHTEGGCSQTQVFGDVRGTVRLVLAASGRATGCYEDRVRDTYVSSPYAMGEEGGEPTSPPEVVELASRIAFVGTHAVDGEAIVLTLGRVAEIDGCATTGVDVDAPPLSLRCTRLHARDPRSTVPLPGPVLACAPASDARPSLAVGGVLPENAIILGETPGVRVVGNVMWGIGSEDWFVSVAAIAPETR